MIAITYGMFAVITSVITNFKYFYAFNIFRGILVKTQRLLKSHQQYISQNSQSSDDLPDQKDK